MKLPLFSYLRESPQIFVHTRDFFLSKNCQIMWTIRRKKEALAYFDPQRLYAKHPYFNYEINARLDLWIC
jgi:hypothetical protein